MKNEYNLETFFLNRRLKGLKFALKEDLINTRDDSLMMPAIFAIPVCYFAKKFEFPIEGIFYTTSAVSLTIYSNYLRYKEKKNFKLLPQNIKNTNLEYIISQEENNNF